MTKRLKQKDGEMEDRISNLPDELLSRILYFVPTEDAVRTGILSRRWKSIWTYLPILDLYVDRRFDLDEIAHSRLKEMLRNFVGSALLGHKMPYLEYVMLDVQGFEHSVIISWISAVIERNIPTLCLCAFSNNGHTPLLPRSLFSDCKLVKLVLDVEAGMHFPDVSPTCFPKLEILHLRKVSFIGEDSASNLISSCPVLQELYILTNYDGSFKTLNVTSHSLKIFSLSYLVSLRLMNKLMPKIFIDAPALKYIYVSDNVTKTVYEVKDVSSLVKADIWLFDDASKFPANFCALRIFELLDKMSNIKSLSLSNYTVETLSRVGASNVGRWKLPVFHNLTSLECYCSTHTVWDWKSVMAFLKSSPILEVLIFKGFSFSNKESGNLSDDVPSCLITHLKTIKISEVSASGYEVENVRYFLKNAKVLEKMIIEGIEAGQVLTLPRASPTCQIQIRY